MLYHLQQNTVLIDFPKLYDAVIILCSQVEKIYEEMPLKML